MSVREDNDSDAPEEFTTEQGLRQDEEIQRVQRENKSRVVREAKERRRKWAQNITPRPSKAGKNSQIVIDSEPPQKLKAADGFLPEDIVQMLAARENHVSFSDTKEEKDETKSTISRKRKSRKSGLEFSFFFIAFISVTMHSCYILSCIYCVRTVTCSLKPVILSKIGPPQCSNSALEFLKERKMSVRRSSSVLNNSKRALRLLSRSGVLGRK
ncbi:hypothetical protein VIGAN_10172800 [Vigna angularis var. angularis]|uniref:Uncharacterized protein n=1 Tax=Vigna angularis var. angularis TaxID=157739 RepID=A0A0S3T5K4_PHAAN|nr:hypothetical protein VIGAN_10172800 [Vigna angularis var. angularis]